MDPVIITVIAALVICFTPKVKYFARMLGTIIHELGHAVVVIPFGGRLQGIKLQLNTEGEAVVGIPQYPFPWYQTLRIINLFAGYGAPLYVAALLYAGYHFEWILALQIVFAMMSIAILLFIRNLFGLGIALLFAVMNTVMIFLLPQWIIYYALGFSVILLVRGITDIYNIARWTFKNSLPSSDFVLAANELKGTPQMWFIFFCIFHAVVLFSLGYLIFANR